MKGLLHSKRLRRNLYKWLFMYVGTILLLTTVITYSKYVSTLMSDGDSARVAKFDFAVEEEGMYVNCTPEEDVSCETVNIESIRPSSDIYYYFTLDTSKLEVSTEIELTAKISEYFDYKINEIVDGKIKNITGKVETTEDTGIPHVTQVSRWIEKVAAGKGNKKRYQIALKYKTTQDNDLVDFGTILGDEYNILRIDYDAEQINSKIS